MPDSLFELLEQDAEALDFFESLPMFVQDQMVNRPTDIRSKEELSGYANMSAQKALKLDQYRPMFEDETASGADWV